jgi:cytochrome c biogenesis protein
VPRAVLNAYVGDLGLDSGARSVYRLDTDKMTQVKNAAGKPRPGAGPGEALKLPDGQGSIRFDGVRRFATPAGRARPASRALVSALLALVGLMLSLFVKRRRVWFAPSTTAAGVRWSSRGPGTYRGGQGQVADGSSTAWSLGAPEQAPASEQVPDRASACDREACNRQAGSRRRRTE